jgi:hypothetical protein
MAMNTAVISIKPRNTIMILLTIMFIALLARVAALQFVEPVPHLRVTESGRVVQKHGQRQGFHF